MSVENDLYLFVKAAVDAASSGPLFGIEVHPTPFSEFKSEKGVAVWHTEGELNPDYPGDGMLLLDAVTVLNCYASAGRDKSLRSDAREDAFELAAAIARLFFDDETMGGRARNSRQIGVRNGMSSADGKHYAVSHLAMVVNETGDVGKSALLHRAFK